MNNKLFLLYTFLFINTLITGIFGIFIPLHLFNTGFVFSEISFFLAFNSLSFMISLFFIERIISKYSLRSLMRMTFLLYGVMISAIFFLSSYKHFLLITGIINGIYLSFFWIVQRILFLNSVKKGTVGRNFANLQIFVLIISKIAILTGSYMLDAYGFGITYFISLFIIILSLIVFSAIKHNKSLLLFYKPMSLPEIISFKDKYNSSFIFLIDGVFIYVEAYYWLLVIFLFMESSFFSTGILTVIVTSIFYALYLIIRSIIDRVSSEKLLIITVILYSFSWALRFMFDLPDNSLLSYLIITIIGFFTMLFRLVYNKIFFIIAKKTIKEKYIFLKSYYSQAVVTVFFFLFGAAFLFFGESVQVFKLIFAFSSAGSFLYLFQKV